MEPRLRSRFVRAIVESLQAGTRGQAISRLKDRLPQRLANVLADEVLAARSADDTLALDDGEALLIAVDTALGDGSGRVLEDAGRVLSARLIAEAGTAFRSAQLADTVERLRGPLAHPFHNAELMFTVERNAHGFTLTVGVGGRPLGARVLSHIAAGYIRAAATAAGITDQRLRMTSAVRGDRAEIAVRMVEAAQGDGAPPRRRQRQSTASFRATNVAAEVDRILARSSRAPAPTSHPPPSHAPPPSRRSRPALIPNDAGHRGGESRSTTPPLGTPSVTPRRDKRRGGRDA